MTLAYRLKPGDDLGKFNHLDANSAMVLRIEDLGTDIRIHFVDDHPPPLTCRFNEDPIFPMRPDRSTIDHLGPVLPIDVYPRDTLPGEDGDRQRVTKVQSRVEANGLPCIYISCTADYIDGIGVRTYKFALHELVQFPRRQTRPPGNRAGTGGTVQFFGPYLNVMTEARFLFAYHPHGHGRWPATVRPYSPDLRKLPNDQAHHCRYPKKWDTNLHPLSPDLPTGNIRSTVR